MAEPRPILVLLGPTASGKSELAMAVARQMRGQILSLDSMQVYRGMNVGTAKPGDEQMAEIPHHLIDVVEPNESFTVARFLEMAESVIDRVAAGGHPLIATGGTPLYYKALFQGLFEAPTSDESLREKLRQQTNESLHLQLSQIDPAAATRIHVNDTKRLIRAIEVFQLTGKPISSLQTEWDFPPAAHPAVWVGLHWDRDALNRRINARVRSMLAGGWLDETQSLLRRFGALSLTAGQATGYSQLIAHLQGEMSLEDAAEQIKIATRQLARRQMKWFRRFPNVHWLNGDQPVGVLCAQILELWQNPASP